MRVGFFFWPYTPEYTARMARLGEELGFDLVGIADTPGNALDPGVAMAIAAGHAPRLDHAPGAGLRGRVGTRRPARGGRRRRRRLRQLRARGCRNAARPE